MKPALLLLVLAAPVFAQPSEQARLEAKQAQFAPVDLKVDAAKLPENERQALGKLVEAARVMDALYLRQVWSGSETMLLKLLEDETPAGRARLRFFLTMKGPWDRQEHNASFIAGAPAKPAEANFYPAGATKEEIERWINGLSDADKAQATGFFTTIRRGQDGKPKIVPYSLEYQPVNNKRDGKWRAIKVEVSNPDLISRSRQGYFAR